MDKNDINIPNLQEMEALLENIRNNNKPDVDMLDLIDMCEYLYSQQRFDDLSRLTLYGNSIYPENTDIMIIRAKMFIDSGHYKDASNVIEYLEETCPDDPDLSIVQGWFFLKQNKIQKSLTYFDRAVELDKIHNLGLAYEIAVNLNQFGFYKHALRYLKPLMTTHANDTDVMFEVAYSYEKTGRIDESIHLYEEIVDNSPFFESAWYNLAILYGITEQLEKALMAYDTAVAINPQHSESYYNMANTYILLSRYEEAIECYSEYASLCNSPFNPHLYTSIGECWWELENYEMAKKFYKKALELDTDRPEYMYTYALCLIELSDNYNGIKLLNRAIKILPDSPDLHFAKAQAYFNLKQRATALDELMAGLKKGPESVLAWYEALKLFIEVDESHSPFYFIDKHSRRFGRHNAFKFIKAFVKFHFEHTTELPIKILDKIAQDERDIIFLASEDIDLCVMLTHPEIAEMLAKHNITIEKNT